MYRPPQGNVESLCNYITTSLNTIDGLERYEVTVMGDINVDYLDKKEPNLKHMKHMERSNGLRQLISDEVKWPLAPNEVNRVQAILPVPRRHHGRAGGVPVLT